MTAAQAAADMEDRIRAGEYPPGSRLPTTRELAVLYAFSTGSATKVYLLLRERGLIEGVAGIGIYVREDI